MNVQIRDNKTDGAALVRIARELRELLLGDCEACKRRVPRHEVEGCDPPRYVHWYPGSKGAQSTCAPCKSDAAADVLADVDTVELVGAWLYTTSPIVLPMTLPGGGLMVANVPALSAAWPWTAQ